MKALEEVAFDFSRQNHGNQKFTLSVRFMSSNTPMYIDEGTHEECLTMARRWINLVKKEHEIHKTEWSFTTTVNPSTTVETAIMVHGTSNKSTWERTRLWMTLEIRKKIDKSEWDSLPGSSTVVNPLEQREMASDVRLHGQYTRKGTIY